MNLNEKWHLRMLRSEERNEPLYVTHEEYAELREMERKRQQEEGPRRIALPGEPVSLTDVFLGRPVVVDDDRARFVIDVNALKRLP